MTDSSATPVVAPLLDAGPDVLRGRALVLLSGLAFSSGGLLVRLIADAGLWQIIVYRGLGLLATLLLLIAWRYRGDLATPFRRAGPSAAVGGLCIAGSFISFIYALTHTTVANTLFLLAVAPLLAAVLGQVVLGETVRRATWFAMAGALLGVGAMVADGLEAGGLQGNLAALSAALGFAGFTVALRWGRAADMTPAVCYAGLFSTTIGAGVALLFGFGLEVSAHDLGLCLLLGVAQVGCGLWLYTMGSRFLPAAELTVLSLAEVVFGPIWVWLALGEAPTALGLIGGVIVLAAITGNALSGVRRRRPPIGAV